MPGKIIQGLKIVKTRAPVFMIDEIDKMGQSYQGDPASALLEVLDPEQNSTFRDHYLDLPFDISSIFFVVTANTLDSIPGPLLDRMEIIKLPGYIDAEKLEIAKNYLIPRSLERNGLRKTQVRYTRDALLHIANGYAREAGVRNFEKNLDKIHRKLAKQLIDWFEEHHPHLVQAEYKLEELKRADVTDETEELIEMALEIPPEFMPESKIKEEELKVAERKTAEKEAAKALKERGKLIGARKYQIDKAAVEKHLGKPLFDEDEVKRATCPGMSVGLAWTSMGGDTLVIEAVSIPGKEGFTLTGQMGDVMKESASLALSFVRKQAVERFGVELSWFEKNHIHLHIPEGATPKDGPSAGITMATALLSLATGRTIPDRLAMTGELSLTGQVLAIGGLKEKTIAARRNKVTDIVIPKPNVRDLDDIPEYVRKGIDFHPVETFEELLPIIFPGA